VVVGAAVGDSKLLLPCRLPTPSLSTRISALHASGMVHGASPLDEII